MNILQIEPTQPWQWGRALPVAALFACFSLILATLNNEFPIEFHPDESSKVRQIQSGSYDYHHPLLMLRAAELMLSLTGGDDTRQQIVMAGRRTSALANAAAIFCLVLVAARLGGPLASLTAGMFLVTNHSLFELAHYFKEDTWLLLGISGFLLALVHYDRAPGLWRSGLLGAALGIAMSAKYTAVVLIPVAVGVVLGIGRRDYWRQIFAGLIACVGIMLIVNWPLVVELASAKTAMLRELDLATGGHDGVGRGIPHGYYLWLGRTSTNPVVWALIAAYLATLWPRRRSISGAEWIIAVFPFAFGLLLSFFPQVSYRYFLPGTAILLLLAGLGSSVLARMRWCERAPLGRRQEQIVLAFVLIGGLTAQLPRLVTYYDGFLNGTRTQLVEAIEANVPLGGHLAQDKRVGLSAFDMPYHLHSATFAADLGSFAELRDRGIDYVAVTRRRYGPLFDKAIVAPNGDLDFSRRRAFYSRLFADGELLFEVRQGPVKYLQPHLALYRLPSAEAADATSIPHTRSATTDTAK